MGFPRVKDAPTLSHRDFARINEVLNVRTSKVVQEIARQHRVWMSRALLGRLKRSEFIVLSAITSRTFGWGKAMEKIPLRHLREGIRDLDGEPERDSHGMPWFEGTGLDTLTIRRAIAALQERCLIERFAMRSVAGDVSAYLPMSRSMLCAALLRGQRSVDALVELPAWFTSNLPNPRTYDEDEWCSFYVPDLPEMAAA